MQQDWLLIIIKAAMSGLGAAATGFLTAVTNDQLPSPVGWGIIIAGGVALFARDIQSQLAPSARPTENS